MTTYPSCKIEYCSKPSIPIKGDFILILKIKGKTIEIDSKGDLDTKLKKRLLDLSDVYKCDIIFCATTTHGETVNAVNFMCNKKGYKTVWTSTYQIDGKKKQELVNQKKAEHIINLVQSLGLL